MSKRSSTPPASESTAADHDDWHHLAELVSETPAERRGSWWSRPGLSSRGERAINVVGGAVVLALAVGWTWSIAHAEALPSSPSSPVAGVTAALTKADAPTTAYLTDATLNAITDRILASSRGTSGKLRARTGPAPAARPGPGSIAGIDRKSVV